MDIAGLAAGVPPGVIGVLLKISLEGYQVFLTAKAFDDDFSEYQHQFSIQNQRLKDWVTDMRPAAGQDKLSGLLDSDEGRYRLIVRTLARIANVFASVNKMEGAYGMRVLDDVGTTTPQKNSRFRKYFHSSSSSPSPAPIVQNDIFKDLDIDIAQVKAMAPQLQSCVSCYARLKWAFSDKIELQTLIERLKSYNEDLCSLTERQLSTMPGITHSEGSFDNLIELPFPPNPDFCGRAGLLDEMHQIFQPPNGKTKREVIILHGMGGIGKTQIALEYAYRHGTSYHYVFWLDAKDMTALGTSGRIIVEKLMHQRIKKCPSAPDFTKISSELGMPGCLDSLGNINYDELKSPWNVAKRWFAEVGNEQWLLLIDNNDDLDSVDLLEVLPSCNWGHVIVTSRREELAFHGHSIPVEEIDDGLGLLLKGIKLKHEDLSKDDLNYASRIVLQLGSFPLALVHAASHMFAKKVDFETYLGRLDKNFMGTFGEIPKVGVYRKGGVFTWELSYQELGSSAARLLHLCAFLSNEDIPDELLQGGEDVAGEWLSADELENAIEELLTFSFVKRKMLSGKSISMHPIVHRWTREHLEANLRREKASEAIRLVASVLEIGNAERTPLYWGFERRIRNHLNLCSQHISDYCVDVEKYPLNKETYVAIHRLGQTHGFWNNYELSIIAYETALIGLQNTVGEDHKQTINVVSSMALTLDEKAEYDNALKWYQRALDGYEKNLGHDDTSILNTFNNMGKVFRKKGEYKKALDCYQRALDGYEKTLGRDHISTLNTVNNMASVFDNQGEYDKALEWYQRALDGYEKTLGRDHISTLDTVYNMAIVFNSQGEYEKALEWYQRALDGYEKTLGRDHISTLDTVYNMAIVFNSQGEYEKALEWYQRALDGYEKTLGRDHISTLNTVYNMAIVFNSQGEYEKALEWYQRALDGYEKTLGRDHISALNTVYNMAIVFNSQGEYEKALEWYQRALDGYEKTLGRDHILTLNPVYNMAIVFNDQGEYEKALEWCQRTLDGYEKTLGRDHISTLDTVYNMGGTFENQEEYDKALVYFNRALDGYRKIHKNDHKDISDAVKCVSRVKEKMGATDRSREATDDTGEKSSLLTGDASDSPDDNSSEEIEGTNETNDTGEIPPNSTGDSVVSPEDDLQTAIDGIGEEPRHDAGDLIVGSSDDSKETTTYTIEPTTSARKTAKDTRKIGLFWEKTTHRISARFRK
ncbi:hypothetical protein BDD12DRAFT_786467 [Trichophaea hybrida]|nr:hypothetical protein BDD12DRAFT_786467 [Trichophaea hybrida]